MDDFHHKAAELLDAGTPFVTVTLVHAQGSTPQDSGSRMIVTSLGLLCGTVGGGKQEFRAIEEAKAMLAAGNGSPRTRFIEWNLQNDLNMVCGGAVKLFFEAFNRHDWQIAIFGAGHVSNALVRTLLSLDCRITVYDGRDEWLAKMPASPKVRLVQSSDLPGEVKHIPDGAYVALMTMGHVTDKPILIEILKTRQFPYIGVIGSAAKAAEVRRAVRDAGLPPDAETRFVCPIGLPIGSNHPGEIAISIAAQLLEFRDRLEGVEKRTRRHEGAKEREENVL